jgi:hypothetical protein
MDSEDNRPIRVTAEERPHPALRILARACIAIARERLEGESQQYNHEPVEAPQLKSGEPEEDAV